MNCFIDTTEVQEILGGSVSYKLLIHLQESPDCLFPAHPSRKLCPSQRQSQRSRVWEECVSLEGG